MPHLESKPDTVHPFGRSLSVAVGIDRYARVQHLQTAVADVQMVSDVLRDHHGYDTKTCTDHQATLAGIRALLETVRRDARQDDQLILYFAGHGVVEESDHDELAGFFVPQDAIPENASTLMPMSEIRDFVNSLISRHVLLVLDCCFAGTLQLGPGTRDVHRHSPMYIERFERYTREPARQVLASAAYDEKAVDLVLGRAVGRRERRNEDPHSPFAQAVADGLRGEADENDDGLIDIRELHLYTERRFADLQTALQAPQQRPQLASLRKLDKGQYVFFHPRTPLRLPSAMALTEANNPYRGLEVHDVEHRELFFGRDELARRVATKVLSQPLTVLLGDSGVGKSSLMRAGLVPRLRDAPETILLIGPFRPAGTAFATLAARWLEATGRALDTTSDDGLINAVSEIRTAGQRVVVLIDQLEELVTNESLAERQRFLDWIARALALNQESMHIVSTLRSDYEPVFAMSWRASWERARLRVPPLDPIELRLAIEGPAEARALFFDPPELVDRLVAAVFGMPGTLPLLSFTLSELYRTRLRTRTPERTLTAADYEDLGGVLGAINQRMEEMYRLLPAQTSDDTPTQATMRHVLIRMVSNEAGQGRRRVPLVELEFSDPRENRRVQTMLHLLTEARLVVTSASERSPVEPARSDTSDDVGLLQPTPGAIAEPPGNEAYVEPAHDALLHFESILSDWVRDELKRGGLVFRRQLTRAAADWCSGGPLWHANRRFLPLAVEALRSGPGELNALEEQFVRRSQARKRRGRVAWISAVTASMLVLVALTLLAQRQQHRAEAAESEVKLRLFRSEMEAGRASLLAGSPLAAARKLSSAYAESPQGSETLLPDLKLLLGRAMRTVDAVVGELVADSEIDAAAWSTDGRTAYLGTARGEVLVWSTAPVARVPSRRWQAHAGGVRAIALSHNGQYLVTGGVDQLAKIWRPETGELVATLRGHSDGVAAIEIDDTSNWIITATGQYISDSNTPGVKVDSTARLWELSTGRLIQNLNMGSGPQPSPTAQAEDPAVTDVAFSPDSSVVATAGSNAVMLWERNGGRLLWKAGLSDEDETPAVAFDRGGTYIAVSTRKALRTYSIRDGKLIAGSDVPAGLRSFVAVSPSGDTLVASSPGNNAVVWSPASKKLVFLEGHQAAVTDARFVSGGHQVVTGGMDRTVRLWDAQTGFLLATLDGHTDVISKIVENGADGHVLSVGADGRARLWNIDTAELTALRDHQGPVIDAVFGHEDQRVLALPMSGAAVLWDLSSQHVRCSIPPPKTAKADDRWLDAATWSRAVDRDVIATWNTDGTVALWEGDSCKLVRIVARTAPKGTDDPDRHLHFDEKGQRLVAGGVANAVVVWDERGKEVARLDHEGLVVSVDISPDGRRVATGGSDGFVKLWDVDSGIELRRWKAQDKTVSEVLMQREKGGLLVSYSADERNVYVWDGHLGAPIATLRHVNPVFTAAFSRDGMQLTTSTTDGRARIWDMRTFQLQGAIDDMNDMVFASDFGGDRGGEFVVSSTLQGRVRLWNSVSGTMATLADFKVPGTQVLRARPSPHGGFVALPGLSRSGTLFVLRTSPEARDPSTITRLIAERSP